MMDQSTKILMYQVGVCEHIVLVCAIVVNLSLFKRIHCIFFLKQYCQKTIAFLKLRQQPGFSQANLFRKLLHWHEERTHVCMFWD